MVSLWQKLTGRGGREQVSAASETPFIGLSELTGAESWLFGGGASAWGPVVTAETAMAVSAVYRCVTLLSGLIASLPLKVYILQPDGTLVEDSASRVARLLDRVPHPNYATNSQQWREMLGQHFLLNGNHFAAIRYDGAGRVIGFEPIPSPALVDVARLSSGRLGYRFSWPDRPIEYLDQANVLHIAGPGFNGIRSPSRLALYARSAVALGLSMQESAGVTHENGAVPSGMVTLPAAVTREDKKKIEAYYDDKIAGRRNRGRLLFVDKDTSFTSMQMTPEDLNLIAARRFQVEDICRFYGVPPHLVGESAAATSWGSGIEQQTLGFLRYTLNPELTRIEAEFDAKLFPNSSTYVRFDRDAMAAMDAKTAAEVASLRIGSGQSTINEERRRNNRPPVEGGDEVLVNSTLITLQRAMEGTTNAPK